MTAKRRYLFVLLILAVASGPLLLVGYAEYEKRQVLDILVEEEQNRAMFIFSNTQATKTTELQCTFENGFSRWFLVPASGEVMASVPSGLVVLERYEDGEVQESHSIEVAPDTVVEFVVDGIRVEWR